MNEQTQAHENAEQHIEQSQTPPIQLAGDLLRKQRLALGMSQKQVADRLRLRETTIESIDKNEFDIGQVDTFVKGYLRSYAKIVGLKEHDVLAAYEQHNAGAAGESAMQSFSRKTKNEKHDNNLMRLTYVIGAVLIGISSLWWWQSQQNSDAGLEEPLQIASEQTENAVAEDPSLEIVEPASDPLLSNQPASNEPASPNIDREAQQQEASEVDLVEVTESNSEPVTEEPVIEQEVEVPQQVDEPIAQESVVETETASVNATENELFMSFSADCWIQIKDASGNVLATGVKNAGYSFSLKGEKPYSIILGAPEGVEMRLASEPVDLSGYTAGKVARFTLP
jgi:cytoskeleton protein RodZ